ncbi:MAG: M20/M25/M40 family metallo-hydrolase [Planctomycetota bacterium]|jgi:hypothetical protein
MARHRKLRFVCLFVLAVPLAGLATTPAVVGQCPTPPPSPERAAGQATTSVGAGEIDLRGLFDELGSDAALWYQHVQTLANPLFEGRAPGTRGGELTEEYLEFYFRTYGLEPAFAGHGPPESGYRQPLTIEGAPREGFAYDGSLSIAGRQLTAGVDFVVTANTANGEVTAPVTFVGYGIDKGESGYTSFGDTADLSGRVALLLRLEPLEEGGRTRWGEEPGEHSSLRSKIDAVAGRGAAGIVVVSPPGAEHPLEELDPLPPAAGFGCTALKRIPTAMITQEAADYLLKLADPRAGDLMTWRRLADEAEVASVDLDDDVLVTLRTNIRRASLHTANVAGVLPGKGSLKQEWIVVGGHHDHVGYGLGGASPESDGKLHAGADDNASGVAAVLVLAKRLAEAYADAPEDAALRSIIFIGFAGEETGLNGSRHFVENPAAPLERVYMMLNLDMVGRLRANTLFVQGVGTAAEFSGVLGPLFERSDLNVVIEPQVGGSDQVSFVDAQVPALFAMTGGHDELHTPLDRASTLNPQGAIRVIDLMQQVLAELAARPQALAFVAQETGEPASCSGPPSAEARPEKPSSGGCGKPAT